MARSIGEAAALGLSEGFNLAMKQGLLQRQEKRQAEQDALSLEDRQRRHNRENTQDQLGALDAQAKLLAQEGTGLAAGTPDEATMAEYTGRVNGLNERRAKLLSNTSGYDVTRQQELGLEGLKKLRANDLQNLKPGDFTRTVTVATRRPPTDYVRQGEAPSTVEQAGEDFMEGMEKGDEKLMLKGANVMYAPEMQVGIGQDTKHGKIVAKEIISLDPDPRSKGEDQRVVPRIRVYVNSGKEVRGPLPEGMPKGATGYYDAPMTVNRSSDPNDQVRSIGIDEALAYLEKQGQMVELMNSPEALEHLQRDVDAPDFNPQDYLTALNSVGVTKAQPTTSEFTVKPNEKRVIERRDSKGNVISSRTIEGGAKPAGRAGTTQEKIDAIKALGPEGDGVLTEEEVEAKIRTLTDTVARGGKANAPKGAGAVGADGTSLKEREQKRKELKDQFERADKNADNAEAALRDFRAGFRNGPPLASRNGGADRRQYDADLADLAAKAKKMRTRAEGLSAELDKPDEEPAKPAAGAKKVIKFDKDGKRVP